MAIYKRANGEVYDPGIFKRIRDAIENFFDDVYHYVVHGDDKPVQKLPPAGGARVAKESPLVNDKLG